MNAQNYFFFFSASLQSFLLFLNSFPSIIMGKNCHFLSYYVTEMSFILIFHSLTNCYSHEYQKTLFVEENVALILKVMRVDIILLRSSSINALMILSRVEWFTERCLSIFLNWRKYRFSFFKILKLYSLNNFLIKCCFFSSFLKIFA
jgi:hypothetical protein